jgi:hypothetical protein
VAKSAAIGQQAMSDQYIACAVGAIIAALRTRFKSGSSSSEVPDGAKL